MTDERMGEALWIALERLPRGAGVIVRHYGWAPDRRRSLLSRIERVGQRRGLVVVGAGGLSARGGAHNARARRGLTTRSAHDRREVIAAVRDGADAILVSPVFATRSHAGAPALGRIRLGLMIHGVGVPVIALGGMTARQWRSVAALGVHGWAGIDAWLPLRADRKRERALRKVGPAMVRRRTAGS